MASVGREASYRGEGVWGDRGQCGRRESGGRERERERRGRRRQRGKEAASRPSFTLLRWPRGPAGLSLHTQRWRPRLPRVRSAPGASPRCKGDQNKGSERWQTRSPSCTPSACVPLNHCFQRPAELPPRAADGAARTTAETYHGGTWGAGKKEGRKGRRGGRGGGETGKRQRLHAERCPRSRALAPSSRCWRPLAPFPRQKSGAGRRARDTAALAARTRRGRPQRRRLRPHGQNPDTLQNLHMPLFTQNNATAMLSIQPPPRCRLAWQAAPARECWPPKRGPPGPRRPGRPARCRGVGVERKRGDEIRAREKRDAFKSTSACSDRPAPVCCAGLDPPLTPFF